jgi:TRAP-type C4-dicarboxylate transport system substrate-binding protein
MIYKLSGAMQSAAVTATLVAVAAFSAQSAQAETLSYGSISPPTHALITEGFMPFAKAVEKDTNGEITFELLAGGSVVSPKTVLSSVGSNLVNAGYAIDVYVPQVLPHSSLMGDLSPFNGSSMVALAAVTEFQLLDCPGCVADFDNAGAVTLGVTAMSPYLLMCKDPVPDLASLKGRKVRTTGVWGRVMAETGMVPVNLPVTDTYEALERGTIDCVVGVEGWLKAYNFWDSVRYVIDQPLGAWAGGHAMTINKETWASFTPEQRGVFYDHVGEMLVAMTQSYEDQAKEIRAEAEKRHLTYVPALPDLARAMTDARSGLLDEAVERAEKRGVRNARELAAGYLKVKIKWEKILAEKGSDPAAIAAALKTEVFDKMPRD